MLDSLLKRGPVVLDFWATWCKPCLRQLDAWKKLSKEFEDVTFVAINEDGPRTQRRALLMVKSRKWEFLILLDDNRKVRKLFQVQAIPHTFIIDKEREILYQHIEYKKKDEKLLRKKVVSLLKNPEESE